MHKSFNSYFSFVNSLAIAKEGELTIGTIDEIQKLHIRSIPLGEHARRISHQEQTRTFALCSVKYTQSNADDPEVHFVRLLDDQTFEFISTYPLDQFEYGCSILSCSFSDDSNVYYCVGTAYVMPEENEPTKVSFIDKSFSNCKVCLDPVISDELSICVDFGFRAILFSSNSSDTYLLVELYHLSITMPTFSGSSFLLRLVMC